MPCDVETLRNLRFRQVVIDEPAVDLIDDGDLSIRSRLQDDAVGLQALVFATRQLALDRAGLVDQHAPQAVSGWPALPKAQLDQAALPGEYLGRQLPAVFASHRTLDALDDGGHGRAVVLELLGAVGDLNSGAAADVLVIGALVSVLKPTPAAHVIDQDDLEVRVARFDVLDQLLQRLATINAQPALAFVGVGPDDLDVAPGGVLTDLVGLVLRRVLLMLGRHPHVLRSSECRF